MTRRNRILIAVAALVPLLALGCAKYNTYYNAKRAFDDAEHTRDERIKQGEEVTQATGQQAQQYQQAITKCKKVIEEYPGHSLTDDALFLMGKSYHRIQSYESSIRELTKLQQNFPASPYEEEVYYLQALNHMFAGDVDGSNRYLELLTSGFPESRYQADMLRVSGENAFTLERWADARDDFVDYLARFGDDEFAPRVGLQLGRIHWQLDEYAEAANRLEAVIAGAVMDKEELFDSRVLLARCLARLGRNDEAEAILSEVEPEGELYRKQGDVALGVAENHLHAGRIDEAKSVLQAMPDEWRRDEVASLTGELLGELHLADWELEEASTEYRIATRNARICEDPDRVRLLSKELQRFLEMENRLDGANDEERPAYRLVQANSLHFALDRPQLALEAYLEVAAAAEHDSISAVRGLYGAAEVYETHFAMPDSARAMRERIIAEFPNSPHAYVLSAENVDLYAHLLAREHELAVIAAAASEASGEADQTVAPGDDVTADPTSVARPAGRYSRWRIMKLERNRGMGRG